MEKEKNNSAWLTITVALITMAGSVTGAFFTSKSTSKTQVDEATKDFRAIHIESGIVEITGNEGELNHPSKDATINFTPRRVYKQIPFDKPFGFIPVVRVNVSAIDASKDANLRIQVYPTQVTSKGFELIIQTWSDTKINFVNASWLAYEQTP